MPNRLADESSPYLLQHAENPVDWRPWGGEALEEASRRQMPIFLSIGYSACHWCHVMAHECFENAEIGRTLNENFISVKVDREERPDLDQIYMEAVQLMTGRGGWPMSVFLTPEGKPFFGGSYWPPRRRQGMPGFDEVLAAAADAWRNRRADAVAQGEQVVAALRADPWREAAGELTDQPLAAAEAAFSEAFDSACGGFGPAPKFPQPIALMLLLRRWQRHGNRALLEMVESTLNHMAQGGIYDHLGGGFHRYSVDRQWLVPHFEKMLYDNALLAGCYLDAYEATGNPSYNRVVRETLDYVLRDMTSPEGGFYSAEDADSEGVEGKFYLWTPAEIAAVLGPERAGTFCRVYDVTEAGNFEGRNILHLARPIGGLSQFSSAENGTVPFGSATGSASGGLSQVSSDETGTVPFGSTEELQAKLDADRQRLLAARGERTRPARDDKILVAWNGLMIDALARAAAVLDEPRYGDAAAKAANFLLAALRDPSGGLRRSWRNGRPGGPAFLDDYASLANALTTLHQQQPQKRWLDEAVALADAILARFADPRGGFFYTPDDHEPLIVRKKDLVDNSTPSGNGLAIVLLLRLADLCGRDDYRQAACDALRACQGVLQQFPTAVGQLLLALDMSLSKE